MPLYFWSRRTVTGSAIGAALVVLHPTAGARAQIQDQWRPVEQSMFDYISDGFAIETILLQRVTPVATQATLYFLRKENVLVRCTETTTRRGGAVVSLTVSCAQLGKPASK